MNVFIADIADDKIELVGMILLAIGFLGFIFRIFKKRGNTVNAHNGSVAIGGNNSASINVANINNKNELPKSNSVGWDIWNIVCGIATLAGLALAAYPFIKG